MDRLHEGVTRKEHIGAPSCPHSCGFADTSVSPRLMALIQLVHELTDDEMRVLPVVLGEALFAMERERVVVLRSHVGDRCDVIWPGQAEMFDVVLASVDIESAVAQIKRSGSGQGFDVPAYSVVVRH